MSGGGEEFRGRIGRTVAESAPWWPAPRLPRAGAPDVVVVVFDDVGFADFGCYGSEIATPAIDAVAASGLRYTNFHTTAICSSSRACLMTGRNHHAVGMGMVANFDTGFPGYRGRVSNSAGMLSEILRGEGYATFATGKWHLTPLDETTAAGPYDQWPLSRGFDRFHGVFVGGSDWAPEYLIHDNHRVETPRDPGYHFSEDIVERATGFVRDHVSAWPEKPYFLYLCFHACHSPLHAPRQFIDRQRGRYDAGWDAVREKRLARQLELGIVPPGTRLAPRNAGVKAWNELSVDERRFCARLQEAYAGMLEHADAQVARLVSALEAMGRRENTLLMVLSDNGGTMEGKELGSVNWHRQQNRLADLSIEARLAEIDRIGGPDSYPVYPAGWGQVSNTPLKRYKAQTHGGGVRDPLVVSWPARIPERGGLRQPFVHMIDILPTVLEATGIAAPGRIRGVPQRPVDGRSFVASLDDPRAADRPRTQYFEMFGNRGIWKDGWKAVTRHDPGTKFDDDRWELYHLDRDVSEFEDLAASHPEKLRELVEAWWHEAERNHVLPLDDRGLERYDVPKPRPITSRARFVYFRGVYLPTEGMPAIRTHDYRITAEVGLDAGSEGVLVGCGDSTIGFAFFVKDGRLVHDYNCAGEHTAVRSTRPVPAGRHSLALDISHRPDAGAECRLFVDGAEAGAGRIPRMMLSSMHSVGLAIGWNAGRAVSADYVAPFAFTGAIDRVVVELRARSF